VTLNILHVTAIAAAYTGLLFLVAWYARRRFEQGRSLVNNPYVYSLSIAVFVHPGRSTAASAKLPPAESTF